jgi:protease II
METRAIRIFTLTCAVLFSVLCLSVADEPIPPQNPPIAKKISKVTEINGRKLIDNYYWLRDKPNPEVRAYLEAENSYTDALMKPTELLQKNSMTRC